MSPRFFVDVPLAPNTALALPAAVAHHAARVLRMKAGDAITLFDGNGGEYAATIARVERERVTVDVAAFDPIERESPRAITLVQAIIAADPMDWAVRKAVELGVAEIVPIVAARTNAPRAETRVAHWRQIAVAACEQCGRNRIPPVAAPMSFSQWLESRGAVRAVVLAPGASRSLASIARDGDVEAVVVGPEGGFDDAELALADRHGVVRVHLGPRILRADTAGVAALATIGADVGQAS